MSTYMYLECHEHEPVIASTDEVGQHHYDLPKIREMIKQRARFSHDDKMDYSSWANAWEIGRGYFFINAVKFLLVHPTCEIGIRDEYGVEYPIEDAEAEA